MLFLFQCPVRCENKELILTVSLICVNFLFSQDVLLASRGLLRSYFVSEKEIKVHQERLFADEMRVTGLSVDHTIILCHSLWMLSLVIVYLINTKGSKSSSTLAT